MTTVHLTCSRPGLLLSLRMLSSHKIARDSTGETDLDECASVCLTLTTAPLCLAFDYQVQACQCDACVFGLPAGPAVRN